MLKFFGVLNGKLLVDWQACSSANIKTKKSDLKALSFLKVKFSNNSTTYKKELERFRFMNFNHINHIISNTYR